jgi:uncharacterized protein YchJ
MMTSIEENVLQTLFRLTEPERVTGMMRGQRTSAKDDPYASFGHYTYVAADKQQDRSFATYDTSRFRLAGNLATPQGTDGGRQQEQQAPKPAPVRHTGPKLKPNDPCPCGSGKKYKKCCGSVPSE